MPDTEQTTLTNNSNENATEGELLFNSKAAKVSLGEKNYREKMIRYLSFCFPGIDAVELHDTLKECKFQVDKAIHFLEKVSGITATVNFVTWLRIRSFNFRETKKNLTRSPNNTNEPKRNKFKLITTSHEVPKKISQEEEILNIIEKNQIDVENATLMQLLARPVVYIERLSLSTVKSVHQNLNKKLSLSSLPHNKINKTIVSDIKTIDSSVKSKVNAVSPRKRKIKLGDKIMEYKKRKTFADINEVNEEINSVLDSDILQSLSSEKIFKRVEDKLKSCDEIILLPSAVISQEKTYNIGKNESVHSNQSIKIKIKIQHGTGVKTFSLINDYNLEGPQSQNNGQKLSHLDDDISEPLLNRMQLLDTNNIHKAKIDEVHSQRKVIDEEVSNDTTKTNNEQKSFKETLCSNYEFVVNSLHEDINKNNSCEEKNFMTTGQETSPSIGIIDLNCAQNIGSINAIEGKTCREGQQLTTNQGISNHTKTAKSANKDSSCIDKKLTTVTKALHSRDTVNLNLNQESAIVNTIKNNNYAERNSVIMSQESPQSTNTIMTNCAQKSTSVGTINNYNSGERHLPMTSQVSATKDPSKTQPKLTPKSSSSRVNFVSNVTIEQAADALLPLIKCLISVTESNNPEIFQKRIAVISNSLKQYLSKVCIRSFNIHSFINMLKFKMSQEDKSPDLDKKIVKHLFKTLSITTDKLVEESEFLLRFYTELQEITNNPKYASDPLALDGPINSSDNAQEMDVVDENTFYDGHSYRPIANVFLSNIMQVHKATKSSVQSTYNSRKGPSHSNVRNRQANRVPVSKSSISTHASANLVYIAACKNNLSGLQFGFSQNTHKSGQVPDSTLSGDSYRSWDNDNKPVENHPAHPNKSLDPIITPMINRSCSNSISSIPIANYPIRTVSNQPAVFSTTSSISSLNSKPVYSVQDQISNARNVLTNFNKIPTSAKSCSSILPCPKYPSKPTLQQSPPFCQYKGNSHLNNSNSKLIYLAVPPGSCSVSLGTSFTSNASQNQGTFSVPSYSHSNLNAPPVPSVSKIVLGCNTQKQLPSGYNTVTYKNNSIQNRETFPVPFFPRSTSAVSNTVLGHNTHKQLTSGYNIVTSKNNSIQSRGIFPAPPPIPHFTSNTLSLSPVSNTVSGCNSQKQLSSEYNTVTFNNNSIQNGGTFPALPVPRSISNGLPSSSVSNTVVGFNTHCQLQRPPIHSVVTFDNNRVHNQIRLNNDVTSISSVPPLSNNGTKNPVVFASNGVNGHFPSVYPNNETNRLILREPPVANVSSMVPKVVPIHVPVASNQKRTALTISYINDLSLTRNEAIVGDEKSFLPSHQSLQQVGPQNCVVVNSDEGRSGGKGEDNSMASLKSYKMNMISLFPNQNENCLDTMEFIDLDYYYGYPNNNK